MSYMATAANFYDPVAERLIELKPNNKPLVIALNGSQGSGKTTLADYLCYFFESKGYRSLSISLDDFYLCKAKREELASDIHPLFMTRGVPGTHDIPLLQATLEKLISFQAGIKIPRFNKAVDDVYPDTQWQVTKEPIDFVVFEGWCWGARHQENPCLLEPVNDLEQEEDVEGLWRCYANEQLKTSYEPLYELMDVWLMLKAPSFDCIHAWRLEQEQKLKARLDGLSSTSIMSEDEISRFIKFYERMTKSVLVTLPKVADLVWELDQHRNITSVKTNGNKFNE